MKSVFNFYNLYNAHPVLKIMIFVSPGDPYEWPLSNAREDCKPVMYIYTHIFIMRARMDRIKHTSSGPLSEDI